MHQEEDRPMTGQGRVKKGTRKAQVHRVIERLTLEAKQTPSAVTVRRVLAEEGVELDSSYVRRTLRALVDDGALSEPHGPGEGYRLEQTADGGVVGWACDVASP
jgi:DNA-binding IscR family transcriptional regulator